MGSISGITPFYVFICFFQLFFFFYQRGCYLVKVLYSTFSSGVFFMGAAEILLFSARHSMVHDGDATPDIRTFIEFVHICEQIVRIFVTYVMHIVNISSSNSKNIVEFFTY